MHTLAALLLVLPLTALAASHESSAHRRRAARWEKRESSSLGRREASYVLQDDYTGQKLLDGFTFFTGSDPTHGQVEYVDAATALNEGLAAVQADNVVKLAVDSTTWLQTGQPRKSVRIESKKTYNSGLFIASFFSMPHGCGTWPAYWSVGVSEDWPKGGELDIIEGVNNNQANQITAHTGPTCNLTNTEAATGHLVSPVCTSTPDANTGCPFTPPGNSTYGHAFNMNSGGAYAHLWNDQGIQVWFFERSAIPGDIAAGNPDPSSWGPATAMFMNSDSCDTSQHFQDHQLVLNIDVGGDWTQGDFPNSGCPGTLQQLITNPANFKYAQWAIEYLKVYQPQN